MRKAKLDRDGRSKADRACGVMEGRRLTEVVEFCGIELSNWNLGTLKGNMMTTSNPNGCVLTGQSQQKDQTRRKLDWSEWRVRVESACVHKKRNLSLPSREKRSLPQTSHRPNSTMNLLAQFIRRPRASTREILGDEYDKDAETIPPPPEPADIDKYDKERPKKGLIYADRAYRHASHLQPSHIITCLTIRVTMEQEAKGIAYYRPSPWHLQSYG